MKSTLRIHPRAHAAEKPFKRNECEQPLCVKSLLNVPQSGHTGQKPHVGNKGRKAFSAKSNLTVHQDTFRRETL